MGINPIQSAYLSGLIQTKPTAGIMFSTKEDKPINVCYAVKLILKCALLLL